MSQNILFIAIESPLCEGYLLSVTCLSSVVAAFLWSDPELPKPSEVCHWLKVFLEGMYQVCWSWRDDKLFIISSLNAILLAVWISNTLQSILISLVIELQMLWYCFEPGVKLVWDNWLSKKTTRCLLVGPSLFQGGGWTPQAGQLWTYHQAERSQSSLFVCFALVIPFFFLFFFKVLFFPVIYFILFYFILFYFSVCKSCYVGRQTYYILRRCFHW